jgi:hypothetical protein
MTGALVFDERTDRYDIRFDLASYYGGLHWHSSPLLSVSGPEKNAVGFFKVCGAGWDAETGGVLPTSPAFCAVVHLFAPPRFPPPLKNIDFTGVFHVFLWQRP